MKVRFTAYWYVSDDKNDSVAELTVVRQGCLTTGYSWWVSNLYVLNDYRKNGYARKLMTEAIDAYGDRNLYLSVDSYRDSPIDSARLAEFYKSFGFKETDVPNVLMRIGKRKIISISKELRKKLYPRIPPVDLLDADNSPIKTNAEKSVQVNIKGGAR